MVSSARRTLRAFSWSRPITYTCLGPGGREVQWVSTDRPPCYGFCVALGHTSPWNTKVGDRQAQQEHTVAVACVGLTYSWGRRCWLMGDDRYGGFRCRNGGNLGEENL